MYKIYGENIVFNEASVDRGEKYRGISRRTCQLALPAKKNFPRALLLKHPITKNKHGILMLAKGCAVVDWGICGKAEDCTYPRAYTFQTKEIASKISVSSGRGCALEN